MPMKRDELVTYLDGYLGVHEMQDYSQNGLQVEGADEIDSLALAVDTNLDTIDGAVMAHAQMLIVHHGLFWGKPLPIVGPHRRRVQALLRRAVRSMRVTCRWIAIPRSATMSNWRRCWGWPEPASSARLSASRSASSVRHLPA